MTRTLPEPFDLVFVATGEIVRDVEALIGGVLGAEGWPAYLEPADEAELFATLLGDAVVLERRYRAIRGIEARPWLFERLRFKARDWRRVFLRHAVAEPDAGLGDGSHGAPGEVAGDLGDPGRDALRRLLEGGDRTLLREIEALGLSAPPGARGVSPGARRRLARLDRQRRARLAALERKLVAA